MAPFTTYHHPPIAAADSPAAPRFAATAAGHPRPRRLLGYLLLAGLSLGLCQCQPTTSTEQAATSTTPADSLKLETAEATPIPKFDIESPIMRQLALLPAAERNTTPAAMRRYQQVTRRFWLAQYSTEYLLKEAKAGPANLIVFARQLSLIQSHWRVVRGGIDQAPSMPPTMTAHLQRMRQAEEIQQAALSDLYADYTNQRPLALDAANLAAQPQVAKLLAPLKREPAPMNVRIH